MRTECNVCAVSLQEWRPVPIITQNITEIPSLSSAKSDNWQIIQVFMFMHRPFRWALLPFLPSVFPFFLLRWDRPFYQLVYFSSPWKACQCAGGYHLHEDVQQATGLEQRKENKLSLARCKLQVDMTTAYKLRESMVPTHIHGYTSDFWPAVSLDLVLVIGSSSLQQWLVDPSTSCDHTHHSSTRSRDGLEKSSKITTINFY